MNETALFTLGFIAAIVIFTVLDFVALWLLQRYTRFFCRRDTVRVIRWHPFVVRDDMQGKQLYIDRYEVHNFVQCCKCRRVLNTQQRERIYEERP